MCIFFVVETCFFPPNHILLNPDWFQKRSNTRTKKNPSPAALAFDPISPQTPQDRLREKIMGATEEAEDAATRYQRQKRVATGGFQKGKIT